MSKLVLAAFGVPIFCGLVMAGACLSQAAPKSPLTVVWSYDTSGYMETCGCSARQLGGLTRRATKMAQLREAGPVLAIEGQHIMADKGDFNLFKGQTIINALNRMEYDILALGVREAQLGKDGLSELIGSAEFPCIASNLLVDGEPWAHAYATVEIAGANVAVIAVSDPEAASFGLPDGVSFSDPSAAIDNALSSLPKSDIVLACLEGSEGWISAITMTFGSRIDLYLTGDRNEATAKQGFSTEPARMNVFDRGRYVGLVSANPDTQGYSFSGMSFGLSEDLEDEPGIRAMLDNDFKPHLKDYFGVTKESLLQLFMPPSYCGDCHKAEYESYMKTGHSRARETLDGKGQTYNPDCMKCHINYDPKEDKIYSMTCVVCHTNITEDHVWQATMDKKSVVKPESPVTTYTYSWCVRCHDPINSVEFEAHWPQYVNKIYHGGDKSAAEEAAKELGIDMSDPPPAHP